MVLDRQAAVAQQVKRPGVLGILGEWRIVPEVASSIFHALNYPWLRANRGTSKSVMLIPGFMAGDITLAPLASFCTWLGHRVEFGGIWANNNCPRLVLEQLVERLARLNRENHEPVVLIGHSLGGIYARELAHRYPEWVERIITLGAPINAPRESCHTAVRAVAVSMAILRGRREGCLTESCSCGVKLTDSHKLQVPATVLYSRTDGIVHWESCMDNSGADGVDHVEVMGSHIGMAVSPQVFRIVSERLATPRMSKSKPQTRVLRLVRSAVARGRD